jgi:hypothetical protein
MDSLAEHHQNDNDTSKIQCTSDMEPKSSKNNLTGCQKAQGKPSDADATMSEMSEAFHLPMSLKHHITLQPAKDPWGKS